MAKTKTTKRTTKTKEQTPGDVEVTMCRRRGDRRSDAAKTTKTEASINNPDVELVDDQFDDETPAIGGRPKVQRRRQIDPTTCERDYTDDEIEFMHAMDAYKRSSGRMFPTCSEVLEVVRGLGYMKVAIDEEASVEVEETEAEVNDLLEIGSSQSS